MNIKSHTLESEENKKIKIESKYNPGSFENEMSELWEKSEIFKSVVTKDKKKFSMVTPPPNITGKLHIGHALDQTIQDIIARFKRMTGYNVCFVPGTDHAGIATQIKVESALKEKTGLTKNDIGREEFLKEVWQWKEEHQKIIENQLKKMGSSFDWSRAHFTMDESCSLAVIQTFVNFYEKGLIYRGNRITNKCLRCETVLSDSEVEHVEESGILYYLKYKIKNSEEYITVATTRPETIGGDVAIAVNDHDSRFEKLVGLTLEVPIVERQIKIIKDPEIDPNFGTGFVKITPAHSIIDYEIGLRHNLPQIKSFDEFGKVNENFPQYKDFTISQLKTEIIKDLNNLNLIEKTEKLNHNVGKCYRCKNNIEPTLSKQWFIKMSPFKKQLIDVVENKKVNFIPKKFNKTYFNWIHDLKDWCISRQLWWGHRIPAYYCNFCNSTIVSKTKLENCQKCGKNLSQDPDVLDTWFSSMLWPFAVFGWPNESEDLKYFYPTDVLVSGYDIIFFWIARMIVGGLENTKMAPFDTVLLHGIVRDQSGRKMSKSLNNGIDPLQIIDEYGADSLRFMLVINNSLGEDIRFDIKKIEAGRNFANKLWNAFRFISMNTNCTTEGKLKLDNLKKILTLLEDKDSEIHNKWIISKQNTLIQEITRNINKFELGVTLEKIYNFIWDDFCNWYIEISKFYLAQKDEITTKVMIHTFAVCLKILHPFMPFITEKIWQNFDSNDKKILAASKFPSYIELKSEDSEKEIENLIFAVTAVRNLKNQNKIKSNSFVKIRIISEKISDFQLKCLGHILKIKDINVYKKNTKEHKDLIKERNFVVTNLGEIYLIVNNFESKNIEINKSKQEKLKLESEINRISEKLNNTNFIEKAPKEIIESAKTKKSNYEKKLNILIELLSGDK